MKKHQSSALRASVKRTPAVEPYGSTAGAAAALFAPVAERFFAV